MRRFEIYWVNPTVGSEIQKTRPCLIISPNELNYLKTRLIAPITSRGFAAPYRVKITLLDRAGLILLEQIRCVSVQRLGQKIGELNEKEAKKVRMILRELFE